MEEQSFTPDELASAVEHAAAGFEQQIEQIAKCIGHTNPRLRRTQADLDRLGWVRVLRAAAITMRRGAENWKAKQAEAAGQGPEEAAVIAAEQRIAEKTVSLQPTQVPLAEQAVLDL